MIFYWVRSNPYRIDTMKGATPPDAWENTATRRLSDPQDNTCVRQVTPSSLQPNPHAPS